MAGGVGAQETTDQFDCGDSNSQAEAQAELQRDLSDPSGLDDDNDGQACEDYDYAVAGGRARTIGAQPTASTAGT